MTLIYASRLRNRQSTATNSLREIKRRNWKEEKKSSECVYVYVNDNSNNTYVSSSEQWRRHRAKLSWTKGMYVCTVPGGGA